MHTLMHMHTHMHTHMHMDMQMPYTCHTHACRVAQCVEDNVGGAGREQRRQ